MIQTDTDEDGYGNICDTDDDNDNIIDQNDNCIAAANANQLDSDGDLAGDACDPDDDNDGVIDSLDAAPVDPQVCVDTDGDACDDCSGNPASTTAITPWALYTPDPNNDGADINGDGRVDLNDIIVGLKLLTGAGPDELILGGCTGDGVIGMPEVLHIINSLSGVGE